MKELILKKNVKKESRSSILSLRKINWRPYAMVIALAVIAIFFQINTNGIFLRARNFSILMRQMSIIGIITLGMALLIISGNFDLAAGSTVALAGGVAAVMQVWYGWNTLSSVLIGVLVGGLLGTWQGFWVAYRKIPSFIVTLGGLTMFRGIYLVITKGITITPLTKSFTFFAQGFVPKNLGMALAIFSCLVYTVLVIQGTASKKNYGIKPDSVIIMICKIVLVSGIIILTVIMMNYYLGIPIPVIIMLVIALLLNFISIKTVFGRNLYAIGGNIEAARFSGINIKKTIMIMFVIMGALCALSGILLTGRLDGATASAGTMFELDAIAACVIGGTSLKGGKGSISMAIIGALVMASLDNGMSLMNISSYAQYIIKGLVLILAVWFDVAAGQKNE
ncbi:MAG: sugar ABC transporter permease [Firmicutes bacterium HGW-Firmicutes-7]|nr:MAG: sugar ABC transporter permease [Firmicutes bacterium HGW-Firmicutes-7]